MPLQIATIAPSFYPAHVYGGPIRSTLQLAQGLVRAGCEVRVLTTNAAGKRAVLDVDSSREQTLPGGVQVRYTSRLLPETVAPRLLTLLSRYVAWSDIVHLVGVYNFPTFPTLLSTRRQDKVLFWSPRGSLQHWAHAAKPQLKRAYEQLARHMLPRSTVLHVTSEDEGREASQRLGGLPYVVVPNGLVAPEHVQHAPSEGPLRIVFLGRLDPKKGIPNLLQACVLLPALGLSSFELTIAGGGPDAYERRLRDEVQSLGLARRVRFIGAIGDEHKADFFSRADLLVMPSFVENFGIVVAEALAHAVPVIASRNSPWSQLLAHDCGLWVDNQPRELAEAIVSLSQRDLRALGQRGRELVMRDFGWDSLSARMKASYEAALARHVASARRAR